MANGSTIYNVTLRGATIIDPNIIENAGPSVWPLRYLKNWQPFRIDALGLVTLLGAEEVNASIGTLVRSHVFEYMPLLGAFVISSDAFTEKQAGFNLYNITAGIVTPEMAGWITRWMKSQNFHIACSKVTWRIEPKVEKRHFLERYIDRRNIWALLLGIVTTTGFLALTLLMNDWWGFANATSMAISVLVRWYVVKMNRDWLDESVERADRGDKSNEKDGRIIIDENGQPKKKQEVKLIVVLSDSTAVTMYSPGSLVRNCFVKTPEPLVDILPPNTALPVTQDPSSTTPPPPRTSLNGDPSGIMAPPPRTNTNSSLNHSSSAAMTRDPPPLRVHNLMSATQANGQISPTAMNVPSPTNTNHSINHSYSPVKTGGRSSTTPVPAAATQSNHDLTTTTASLNQIPNGSSSRLSTTADSQQASPPASDPQATQQKVIHLTPLEKKTDTTEKNEAERTRYDLVRWVGWLAFGGHVITIGMSDLVTQLITVVIIVGPTLMMVMSVLRKLHCEERTFEVDPNNNDEEVDKTDSTLQNATNPVDPSSYKKVTECQIGSRLVARIENWQNFADEERRVDLYASLDLTTKEEGCLRRWGLTPDENNTKFWKEYDNKKDWYKQDLSVRTEQLKARQTEFATKHGEPHKNPGKRSKWSIRDSHGATNGDTTKNC